MELMGGVWCLVSHLRWQFRNRQLGAPQHVHCSLDSQTVNMDHITNFADLTHLDNAKFQILQNTVKSILTSTIAEDSFAQIIDGQPTRLSFEKNFNYDRPLYDAAGVSEATEPSPKSLQLFRTIRADFALQGLKINAQVCHPPTSIPEEIELCELHSDFILY